MTRPGASVLAPASALTICDIEHGAGRAEVIVLELVAKIDPSRHAAGER